MCVRLSDKAPTRIEPDTERTLTLDSTRFRLEVVPRHVLTILALLDRTAWQTGTDLVREAQAAGYRLLAGQLQPNLRVLRDTGLVERDVRSRVPRFRLLDLGARLYQQHSTRPNLYGDLLHYVFFAHAEDTAREGRAPAGWSWVYQATCRLLWDLRPQVPPLEKLAAALGEQVAVEHPSYAGGVHRVSPTAVQLWLRELEPAFLHLEDRRWTSGGRAWCTPELLLLGIALLYRRDGTPWGTPLLLSTATINALSYLCLSEGAPLDSVLDVAVATFSVLQIHSGEWGRAVILNGPIVLVELL